MPSLTMVIKPTHNFVKDCISPKLTMYSMLFLIFTTRQTSSTLRRTRKPLLLVNNLMSTVKLCWIIFVPIYMIKSQELAAKWLNMVSRVDWLILYSAMPSRFLKEERYQHWLGWDKRKIHGKKKKVWQIHLFRSRCPKTSARERSGPLGNWNKIWYKNSKIFWCANINKEDMKYKTRVRP